MISCRPARVVQHALSPAQTNPDVLVFAQEFSVRFSFSRLQMRVQHQAIKLVMQPDGLGAEVLLPTKEVSSSPIHSVFRAFEPGSS
jgi:hypothetical protein